MTPSDLLEHIFERLSHSEAGAEIFGADEVAQWPDGALANLVKAQVLRTAQPAQIIECDGCERNCFMQVHVRPTEGARAARAFISCDKPEDMGRIRVELSRLEQWQITCESLARALAQLLGFTKPARLDGTGKCWVLGLLTGGTGGCMVTVTLSGETGVTLMLGEKNLSLSHMLTLATHALEIKKDALLRILDSDSRQPVAGIGSPKWRRRQAQAAASARHSKPGGSQDKQKQIRAAWASGKYTSRDICAEQECAGLDISFSAARRALRNTPAPKRPA